LPTKQKNLPNCGKSYQTAKPQIFKSYLVVEDIMKEENKKQISGRRNFMKACTLGSAAGRMGFLDNKLKAAPCETPGYAKAAPVTIMSGSSWEVMAV
jgi:hypothetical protein